MAFFDDLNTKIIKVQSLILSNPTLLKYIYYADSAPLSNPDIAIPSSLIMKNIFPMPKNPDANDQGQTTYLNFYFGKSQPYEPNSGFRIIRLYFDVMSHLSIWKYGNGIRPYSICHEIDSMFNNQLIPQLSNNLIYFENMSPAVSYSQYFYGYQLCYKLSIDSNVVLKK